MAAPTDFIFAAMGHGTIAASVCIICCFMIAPFVLQTVGLFTPRWGSNSTCESIGLVFSCCSGDDKDTCQNTNGGDELDVRALGLHATSFSVMFLTVACLSCGICCCKNDNDDMGLCTVLGGFCFMLFPVAGLFSVIGCIIVATKFSTSELGYSFALCLTSGCFILLVTITIVGCWLLVKQVKAAKDDDDHVVSSPPRSGNPISHTTQSGALYPHKRKHKKTQKKRSVQPFSGGYVPQNATASHSTDRIPPTLQLGVSYPYKEKRSVQPFSGGYVAKNATASHSTDRIPPTLQLGVSYPYKEKRSVQPFSGGYVAKNATASDSTDRIPPTSQLGVSYPYKEKRSVQPFSGGYVAKNATASDSTDRIPPTSQLGVSYPYKEKRSVQPFSGGYVATNATASDSTDTNSTTWSVDGSYPYNEERSVQPYGGGYVATNATASDSTDTNSTTWSVDGSYPYNEERSVQPYGGEYVAQHTAVEQAVGVHDQERGRFMVFMQRINITRIAKRIGHFDL